MYERYTHTHTHTHYIYKKYIYIHRERERERERAWKGRGKIIFLPSQASDLQDFKIINLWLLRLKIRGNLLQWQQETNTNDDDT